MDVLNVSKEIMKKIGTLEIAKSLLKERAEKKAETMAIYETQLGLTAQKLENGEKFEVEGTEFKFTTATTIERKARCICADYKRDMQLAEDDYKNVCIGINVIQAQLNGLQSIFRNLSEV